MIQQGKKFRVRSRSEGRLKAKEGNAQKASCRSPFGRAALFSGESRLNSLKCSGDLHPSGARAR